MSGKWTLWSTLVAVSLLVPAAAVFAWRDQLWPLVLFVLWAGAGLVLITTFERRHWSRRLERMLARAQQSSIDTLSHHRHDWMNELQILYGYLRLQKVDKAIAIVERIRQRMDQDSRISRLGSPELAAYLLSFRTVCDTIRLEVDIADGFYLEPDQAKEAARLSRAAIGLVNAFRFRASASGDEQNVLRLYFSSMGEALRIEVEYEGELAAEDSIGQEMDKVLEGSGQWGADNLANTEGESGKIRRMTVTLAAERK